jgi:hypothetical protein
MVVDPGKGAESVEEYPSRIYQKLDLFHMRGKLRVAIVRQQKKEA